MQCNCMMGLFPDIKRAWLTIDSDIYVWIYEDGYVDFVNFYYYTLFGVGVEHLIALLTSQRFQIPLTPRMFPV